MTAAGSDGQALWAHQMFPCALPKILLCLALWSWWASCAAADSWGGAKREETASVPRCQSRNGDLRRGKRERKREKGR